MKQKRPIKKILIINIFGIGDVLFTTPMIRNIKKYDEKISIGYLCNQRAKDVLENNENIDRLFIYERDELKVISEKSKFAYLRWIINLIRDIKSEHYDCVIDVSLNGFMSFISFWAGIPLRVGYNYKNRGFLLNCKIPLEGYEDKHIVEYYLDLLNLINIPPKNRNLELVVDPQDEKWADEFIKQNGLNKRKMIIGICPGGGASWGKDAIFKRYSQEKYAKIADKMIENYDAGIILFGDSREVELSKSVQNQMKHPLVLASGKTSVGQYAALAKRCSLVFLNDGGPLHIAVAAGAKTLSIFGPVSENVYGPYPKSGHTIITKQLSCRPCYQKFRRADCLHISCLKAIDVQQVLRKVEEIL